MPSLADITSWIDQQSGRSLADIARPGESASDIFHRYANPEAVLASPAAQVASGFAPLGMIKVFHPPLGTIASSPRLGSARPDMERMVEDYIKGGGRDLGQLASTIAARGDMLPTEVRIMIQNVMQRMQGTQ